MARVQRFRHWRINYTPSRIELLQTLHPDVTFCDGTTVTTGCTGPGCQAPKSLHSHGALATDRAVSEEFMYRHIMDLYPDCRITDVGGSSKRHLNRPNVHCCNPVLSAADHLRSIKRRDVWNTCDYKAQDCPHLSDTVLMFVHSIYYFSQSAIIDIMIRARCNHAFSLQHEFKDVFGGFAAEAKYVVKNGRVAMAVDGGTTYEHDAMMWMHMPAIEHRGYYLYWSAVRRNQLSTVYEFALVPAYVPRDLPIPLEFETALYNDNDFGNLDIAAPGATSAWYRLNIVTVQRGSVVSFGKYFSLRVDGDQREVLVPKTAIATLRKRCLALPRVPSNYAAIVMHAVKLCDAAQMPPDMVPDAALYCATAAWGADAAFEKYLASHLFSRNSQKYGFDYVTPPIVISVTTALLLLVALTTTVRNMWMPHFVSVARVIVTALANAYGSIGRGVFAFHALPPLIAFSALVPGKPRRRLSPVVAGLLLAALVFSATVSQVTDLAASEYPTHDRIDTAQHASRIHSIIVAPVVEELLLRCHPIYEFLLLSEKTFTWPGYVPYMLSIISHHVFRQMPPAAAIGMHAGWNALCAGLSGEYDELREKVNALTYAQSLLGRMKHTRLSNVVDGIDSLSRGALSRLRDAAIAVDVRTLPSIATAIETVSQYGQTTANQLSCYMRGASCNLTAAALLAGAVVYWCYLMLAKNPSNVVTQSIAYGIGAMTPKQMLYEHVHIGAVTADTTIGPTDRGSQLRMATYRPVGATQYGTELNGIGFSSHVPTAYAANAENIERSIRNRAQKPVTIDLSFVRDQFKPFVTGKVIPIMFGPKQDLEPDVVRWNRFEPSRQKMHTNAIAHLDAFGPGMDSRDIHKMLQRSAFIKREKAVTITPMGAKLSDPRLIQGASPLLNVTFAPLIWTVKEALKSRFSHDDMVTWASGCNATDIGDACFRAHNRTYDPVFVENDCSRWDASVKEELLALKEDIYGHFVNLDRQCGIASITYRQLLKLMVDKHGVTTTGDYYSVKGTIASGDADTSLFNFLLNMCLDLYSHCAANHCELADMVLCHSMIKQSRSWKHPSLVDPYLALHAPHDIVEDPENYLTDFAARHDTAPHLGMFASTYGTYRQLYVLFEHARHDDAVAAMQEAMVGIDGYDAEVHWKWIHRRYGSGPHNIDNFIARCQYWAIIQGDDFLALMNKTAQATDKRLDVYKAAGFKPVIHANDQIERVTFCSSLFVPAYIRLPAYENWSSSMHFRYHTRASQEQRYLSALFENGGDPSVGRTDMLTYVLTALPGRQIAKGGWSSVNHGKHAAAIQRSIAVCWNNDFAHVPFMKAIAERVMALTTHTNAAKSKHSSDTLRELYNFHVAKACRSCADTSVFLCARYGPAYTHEITYLSTVLPLIQSIPCLVIDDCLTTVMSIDNGYSHVGSGEPDNTIAFTTTPPALVPTPEEKRTTEVEVEYDYGEAPPVMDADGKYVPDFDLVTPYRSKHGRDRSIQKGYRPPHDNQPGDKKKIDRSMPTLDHNLPGKKNVSFKRPDSDGFGLNLISNPVVEEILKRTPGGIVLFVLEGPVRLFAHVLLAMLPLPVAVLLHYWHNRKPTRSRLILLIVLCVLAVACTPADRVSSLPPQTSPVLFTPYHNNRHRYVPRSNTISLSEARKKENSLAAAAALSLASQPIGGALDLLGVSPPHHSRRISAMPPKRQSRKKGTAKRQSRKNKPSRSRKQSTKRTPRAQKNHKKNSRAVVNNSATASTVLSLTKHREFTRGGRQVVTGHHYLTGVPTSFTNQAKGTRVIPEIRVNPLNFPQTRLRVLGTINEKFLFKFFRLHYDPSSAAGVEGSMSCGTETDPTDHFPDEQGDVTVKFVSELTGASTCAFQGNKSHVWNMPAMTRDKIYYIDESGTTASDVRQSVQAVMHVVVNAPTGATAPSGTFWIEYECELFGPKFDVGSVSVSVGAFFGTPLAGDSTSFMCHGSSPSYMFSSASGYSEKPTWSNWPYGTFEYNGYQVVWSADPTNTTTMQTFYLSPLRAATQIRRFCMQWEFVVHVSGTGLTTPTVSMDWDPELTGWLTEETSSGLFVITTSTNDSVNYVYSSIVSVDQSREPKDAAKRYMAYATQYNKAVTSVQNTRFTFSELPGGLSLAQMRNKLKRAREGVTELKRLETEQRDLIARMTSIDNKFNETARDKTETKVRHNDILPSDVTYSATDVQAIVAEAVAKKRDRDEFVVVKKTSTKGTSGAA